MASVLTERLAHPRVPCPEPRVRLLCLRLKPRRRALSAAPASRVLPAASGAAAHRTRLAEPRGWGHSAAAGVQGPGAGGRRTGLERCGRTGRAPPVTSSVHRSPCSSVLNEASSAGRRFRVRSKRQSEWTDSQTEDRAMGVGGERGRIEGDRLGVPEQSRMFAQRRRAVSIILGTRLGQADTGNVGVVTS